MGLPNLRPIALALAAVAAAACGRVEGRTAWEEAMHAQAVPPQRQPADAVFPVAKPPFSPGIFPCSRCHEGGTPAPDTLPAMPHKRHVARNVECADCHQDGDEAADPQIPSREVCDACHGDPAKLSERERAYFAAVTKADGTTEFPRRWASADLKFEHKRHLAAGVACAKCHGEAADAPFARPKPVTLMARCVSCHEEQKKPVACATCHDKQGEKAHPDVVLRHAEDQRGCLDCHDDADRDHLRLANGTLVSFEESYRLCGQCHGTQFRDWRIGLHGKRIGEWGGRREYMLCVQCHYPHEPRFRPMTPVARPARPEEVR